MDDAEANGSNEEPEQVQFLYKAMYQRDPQKRRVKPVDHHLLQIDFGLSDSDSDSDFEVKGDHESDSGGSRGGEDAGSSDDDQDGGSDDDSDDDDSDESSNLDRASSGSENEQNLTVEQLIARAEGGKGRNYSPSAQNRSADKIKILICCVCLGEVSEDTDEIVECDMCAVPVHEGCYGENQSDTDSASSTQTASSTEPWFCDPCKGGVLNPTCELCPNIGGAFKETDAGRWVHVVCALYVPGVAFADVAKLRWVTLSEMAPAKWGAKACSCCEDERFSQTGVCIGCDAGMCRNFFHVTCAQRQGLLSEASPDEEIADPFYAYCKLHVEKSMRRRKRQNWLAIQSNKKQAYSINQRLAALPDRVHAKFLRYQDKYKASRRLKPDPWVPPEKVPRALTTSASACRRLMRKAELMGFTLDSMRAANSRHKTSHQHVSRKWHIPPAFSAEFVNYCIDRDDRMNGLKSRLNDLMKQSDRLQSIESQLRRKYDKLSGQVSELRSAQNESRSNVEGIWKALSTVAGKKLKLPQVLSPPRIRKPPTKKEEREEIKSPTVIRLCGICEQSHDQHLLVHCDICKKHYHMGCLDPPLTRLPKKSAFSVWQCSECVSSSSDESEDEDKEFEEEPRRKRRIIKEPLKFMQQFPDFPVRRVTKAKGKGKSKVAVKRKQMEKADDVDQEEPVSAPKNSRKSR